MNTGAMFWVNISNTRMSCSCRYAEISRISSSTSNRSKREAHRITNMDIEIQPEGTWRVNRYPFCLFHPKLHRAYPGSFGIKFCCGYTDRFDGGAVICFLGMPVSYIRQSRPGDGDPHLPMGILTVNVALPPARADHWCWPHFGCARELRFKIRFLPGVSTNVLTQSK